MDQPPPRGTTLNQTDTMTIKTKLLIFTLLALVADKFGEGE